MLSYAHSKNHIRPAKPLWFFLFSKTDRFCLTRWKSCIKFLKDFQKKEKQMQINIINHIPFIIIP